MNNVKFLKDKGKLGDIRYWLGIDEDDDSMDGRINAMSPPHPDPRPLWI